jgi:3-mercaptopyruvate sulfurtransferase SseA
VALLLERRGIKRVRPLAGGMAQWMTLGFPVRELTPPVVPAVEESRG